MGICNSCLIKIGATTIVSLTEGTKSSNTVNEQYDKVRLRLLRKHPWNCAMARVKLGQLADAPASEFDHAYEFPADWLRSIAVSDNSSMTGEPDYRIEGRQVLSSADDIYVRYVKDLTDPNHMDAAFREALACALAADVCMALTGSATLSEQMRKDTENAILEARSVDSIEDAVEEEPEAEWITARY